MAATSSGPTFRAVDEVPKSSTPRAAESVSAKAWREAQRLAAKHQIVEADGLNAEEATRFYRAMSQWKRRHPDKRVGVRQVGNKVYVWILSDDDSSITGTSAKRGPHLKSSKASHADQAASS